MDEHKWNNHGGDRMGKTALIRKALHTSNKPYMGAIHAFKKNNRKK